MDQRHNRIEIHNRVANLIRSGEVGGPFMQRQTKIEEPLAVRHPDGSFHSWFIGLTSSDRIIGFVELDSRLQLLRYSSFQRRPESIDNCPLSASWLESDLIRARVQEEVGPEATVADPVLSYDGVPARLAWKVGVSDPSNPEKTFYVVGDLVYEVR